jgi:hypothetical protein
MLIQDLLQKVKTWLDNKPEEAYPLNEPPDPDVDTQREMESKDEATEKSCTLFKIKF